MNRSDFENKLIYFRTEILFWFNANKRIFPWREVDASDYEIVISEILLQRTKADRIKYFLPDFVERFPDWMTIANSEIEVIGEFLKPLGLHQQRAVRLFNLSVYMVSNNEILPKERNELDKVPLMGQYIANAVELLIHKNNMPLLDVNMLRVLERYFGPRTQVDFRYDKYIQELAKKVIDFEQSKFMSWAILDFAALVCKSRKPLCEVCPLASKCLFFKIRNI